MSPDADDLLLFARVAESGSFSRAAERVQLPKSTVSRRIAALEKRLGERLLQRTTRKLVITDFGQGVLDHARALSEEVDAALAFALSRQARPSGRLRVSMPGDFASTALERPLAGFIRDYPEVSLELDLSPRRVDLIGENFDLAIRMGALPDDAQLAARRLAVFTTGLYAAPSLLREHGEPLTPDALLTMPALMLLSRSGDALAWELSVGARRRPWRRPRRPRRRAGRACRAAAPPTHQVVPQQHVRANSPDVLIRLARSGAGVVAVADFFAEPYLARGELQRILPDWCLPDADCWAVFPGRRLMPAKTRAFIDMLARTMSACSEAVDASAAADQRRAGAIPRRLSVGAKPGRRAASVAHGLPVRQPRQRALQRAPGRRRVGTGRGRRGLDRPAHGQFVQHGAGVERADRDADVGRNAALRHQRLVAQRADAKEGREVADFAARRDQFVVELLDQLHDAHVVALRDLLEHLPEQVLQADARDDAVQAHRPGAAFVARRIGADEDFTHAGLLGQAASRTALRKDAA